VFQVDEMKRALDTARANKPGRLLKPVERVLLLCYDYDEETGTIKANVMKIVRTAGVATVLLLGGYLFVNWLRSVRAVTVREAQAKTPSVNGVAHKGD